MANKTDLVNGVYELLKENGVEVKKKDTTVLVDAVLDTIIGLTGEADKLQLIGFGTFSVKERAERDGHNPSTGEKIRIPASKSVGFKVGKAFKEFVQ